MPLKVLRMFWRNSHSRMLFLDETIRSLPNAYKGYITGTEVVNMESEELKMINEDNEPV